MVENDKQGWNVDVNYTLRRLDSNFTLWQLDVNSQPFWLECKQGLPDQSQVDGFLVNGPYKKKMTFLSWYGETETMINDIHI